MKKWEYKIESVTVTEKWSAKSQENEFKIVNKQPRPRHRGKS